MAARKPTEDQIREAAYFIWLAEGQPHGQDEAHWHRAASALGAATPAPKPKTGRTGGARTKASGPSPRRKPAGTPGPA